MHFKLEPAVWVGAIKAVLACLVGFGLKLTPEQMVLLVVALEAIGTAIVRSQVSPAINGTSAAPKE